MGIFGEKIDEYEILEHLGKGGFANVYRARCLRSNCFVAIKMIDKALMASAGMVGRVRQEVTIHSRLKHPAILELYTFFEDAHYVYLVLELAHNGELAKHFRLGTRGLSEKAASDIFKQVVSGVVYLHSHNILHRDLSLNNLLLTKDLQVKIADFGLATQLNAPDEKHVTMCGTPNYISPEVASRNFHGLPADVWGLGCMLYTLLVGSPPFHTQHVKSTLNRVINADYKIPSDLSRQAQDILQRLLCKDPSIRISLKEIMDHPFLSLPSEVNARQDMSRDSGFHTTVHSTQHAKNRIDDRSTASAKGDFCCYNRKTSADTALQNNEPRPASFNVLTGLHDPVLHSIQSNGNSASVYNTVQNSFCGQQSSNGHRITNSAMPVLKTVSSHETISQCTNSMSSNLKEVKSEDENKENHYVQRNPKAAGVGVPPLCADRLPTVSHRTRNAILKILPDSVTVEFIKRKGKDRDERITEICCISKDGMKISVYPVNGGKGKPVSSDEDHSFYNPSSDEMFTYHNLPQKHWKKYLYAARFVDLVKAKTPKITLYTTLAKCQLMENGIDMEMFFYSGEKVTFSSDEFKVIDRNSITHRNPAVTNELKYIFDHFQECSNRIKRVEASLSSIPDECFPLIIGKRPSQSVTRQVTQVDNDKCQGSPVINIGSFCQGSTKANSECHNTPETNMHLDYIGHNGQIQGRRLPLQLHVNLASLNLR